jgi:hypothetical protein
VAEQQASNSVNPTADAYQKDRRAECGCRHRGGHELPDVDQENSNESGDADASNDNWTKQGNLQWQSGTGGNATSGDATGGNGGNATDTDNGCGCEGEGPHDKKHDKQKENYPSNDQTGQDRNHRADGAGDGGNATTGDATGGSVTQTQEATNGNSTSQVATAYSAATQWAENVFGQEAPMVR